MVGDLQRLLVYGRRGWSAPQAQLTRASSAAVRAVAVTYPPDERRHESPDGMAEAFFFILPEVLQGFFLWQLFKTGGVWTSQIVHVNFPDYLKQLPFLWC
jgi:hypothetical protein